MHYMHNINGNQYGIKVYSLNHCAVCKNGLPEWHFDTFEEAQDYIDNLKYS